MATGTDQRRTNGHTGRRCVLGILTALIALVVPITASAASWSSPASIDAGSDLTSVSCPSSSFCVAVDEAGKAVTYNGSSWSAPATIDAGHELSSVSCASASFCVAVDRQGYALTFDSSSWSAPSRIEASAGLASVSCPSSSFCMAVTTARLNDAAYALIYNGSSWGAASEVEGATGGLEAVSCPSSSFCAATGHEAEALTYNGTSWSKPDVIGVMDIPSVSCASTMFCVAGGLYGEAYVYNGTSWSPRHELIESTLASVSCPLASFCMAVSSVAASTNSSAAFTYNGSSWSAADGIDANSLTSVSCPATVFCAAVDAAGDALIYSETSPTPSSSPSSSSSLSSTTTPITTSTGPAPLSTAELRTLLLGQLIPTGKAASIEALLKHDGIAFAFKAPEAGTETMAWYEMPAGAKLTRKTRPKPILVAAGHASVAAAGTVVLRLKLTSVGKRLLARSKRLKIMAASTFTLAGGVAVKASRAFVVSK